MVYVCRPEGNRDFPYRTRVKSILPNQRATWANLCSFLPIIRIIVLVQNSEACSTRFAPSQEKVSSAVNSKNRFEAAGGMSMLAQRNAYTAKKLVDVIRGVETTETKPPVFFGPWIVRACVPTAASSSCFDTLF